MPGAVPTSPALSIDGSKIAFIQSNGSAINLIVLKTALASISPPATPTVSSGMDRTAPCMTVTQIAASGDSDTFSSPSVDYDNDILYVGDDGISRDIFKISSSSARARQILQLCTRHPVPFSMRSALLSTTIFLDALSGTLRALSTRSTQASAAACARVRRSRSMHTQSKCQEPATVGSTTASGWIRLPARFTRSLPSVAMVMS